MTNLIKHTILSNTCFEGGCYALSFVFIHIISANTETVDSEGGDMDVIYIYLIVNFLYDSLLFGSGFENVEIKPDFSGVDLPWFHHGKESGVRQ